MRLKKYVSLAICSMHNTLSYRLSFILNILGSFITLVAMYFIWQAVFAGRTELAGFDWPHMKAYLVVTFLINSTLSYYSESSISGKVLDGSVAMDMLKPLDFQTARLAESLGACVVEGLLGAILIGGMVVGMLGIPLPDHAGMAVLFVLSACSSVLVKFGIVYCAALLCFYTTSGLGIVRARMAVTDLLSGALVPLAFFPPWLKTFTHLLPFQGIVTTPTSIFLSMVDARQAVYGIALQWFWIVVLWLLGKWIWSGAVRQITVHGG